MEKERGSSLRGNDPTGDSHHGSGAYGFVKPKKKDKGYKSVGLVSSDEDDDAAMIIAPSSSQSGKAHKAKPAFRLKKKKSFRDKPDESKDREEAISLQRSSVKHKHHANPFDDKPVERASGKVKRQGSVQEESDTQIFGVPLAKAVQIDRCPDGLEIPAFFRVCVNYIEDNGFDSVGVYRTSGSQTRIHELMQHFNRGDRVRLNDYDVATVADVMKLFIRQLPQKLLPEEYLLDLEEAIDFPDPIKKVETADKILRKLEPCSRTLLGWIFVHMSHIVDHQDVNKMSVKNVALVLEPTLKIQSNKVLNFLLTQPNDVFPDIKISKFAAPASRNSVAENTDQALVQLREELIKKEINLNQLHQEIKQGKASKRKEEQLWDIQRQVTQLKRKIRTFEKMTTVMIQNDGPQIDTKVPSEPPSSVRTTNEPKRHTVQPVSEDVHEEPVSEDKRKEMIGDLLHQMNMYDALLNHNKHLRARIAKETDNLRVNCDEVAMISSSRVEAVYENTVDKDAMVKELLELVEQYKTFQTKTGELNDAICSETSDWIAVVAELNTLKQKNAMRNASSN